MEAYETALLQKAKDFALEQLKQESLPPGTFYHNAVHTAEVVANALEIAQNMDISREDTELLLLAAWFHDVGYRQQGPEHETRSAEAARQFLAKEGLDQQKIETVVQTIMATRMPQSPVSPLGEILCDADLAHLGKKGMAKKSDLLRQELAQLGGKAFSETDWLDFNLNFLRKHQYFTPYAREVFEPVKQKNIARHEKRKKEVLKERDDALKGIMGVDEEKLKALKKKLSKVEGRPERGIETMFRTTSRNHVDFSVMADRKANIMISVNSIIITIILGVILRKLDTNPHLLIPTFLLMGVCLSSIVFAILASRPNITSGTFTQEDIKQKKANLLFFGNFHKMKLQDFQWGMTEMMNDSEYLYGSMIRDIYFLGVVLGKKYRLLRTSYTIFMFGIILASLAFMLATVLFPEKVASGFSSDSIF